MNNMNRRNFIKTIGLATTGLLLPFNTLSNNIDPEILEVYNFVVNKSKESYNPDLYNIFRDLIKYLSNKYSIETLNCIGFCNWDFDRILKGFNPYDGVLLFNNPYIRSIEYRDSCMNTDYPIQKYKSKKFDQIYMIISYIDEKIDENKYQRHKNIKFGRFNTNNQNDFDLFMKQEFHTKKSLVDFRTSKLYNPVLTFNIN